jgi:F420-dependent oxidoreductase-like protein
MTSFGFQIPNFSHAGVADVEMFDRTLALAAAAEASGFESVWVMDHFWQLPALGGPDAPILEAYTMLGALAARTERVRLGTLVSGVTYRNPALLAKMVTTLDVISKGRAILGIGAAWYEPEHEGYHFDFPGAGERLDRLEEAVQICRAMFREDGASFTGRHYSITGARNLPRPIQSGGPPIMIAGGGEKRTLRLVAQYGDMCNVAGDLPTVVHKLEVLRRHCADVGRDPSDIVTTRLGTLMLTDSAEETGRINQFLTDTAGDAFAAQATVGEPDAIVDQVGAIVDAGIAYPIFNMPFSDPETVARVGDLLTSTFK